MFDIKIFTKIYDYKLAMLAQALKNVSLPFKDNGTIFVVGNSTDVGSSPVDIIGGAGSAYDGFDKRDMGAPTRVFDGERYKSALGILRKLLADKMIIVVAYDEKTVRRYAEKISEIADGKSLNVKTKQTKAQGEKTNAELNDFGICVNDALSAEFSKKVGLAAERKLQYQRALAISKRSMHQKRCAHNFAKAYEL